jgi:hypothetical protein
VTTRRGVVWLLGLGAFGLAFSITTTAAYLPPLLEQFTDSNTMIAAVLAAEGVFALTLPLVIGPWSDTFKTPMGRRRPFMLAALPPMGFCLAILAFMPNIWTMTLIVLAFFFAYYVYEPPYRGLYPDILHESLYGRSQGVQHVLRGIALGVALVAGGFLFKVWHPAPFLLAAVATTAACGAVVLWVRETGGRRVARLPRGAELREDELDGVLRSSRGAPLPVRERRLGGHLRRDADVRRPLHHDRPRRAALDVVGRTGNRRRRIRARRARLVEARRAPRARPRDPRRVDRVRRRTARRRARPGVAQLVLRADPARGRRRRDGDDPLVGAALQADARAAPRGDRRIGDDDEGSRAADRAVGGGDHDRRDEALPLEYGRLRALWPVCAVRCSRRSRSSRPDPARAGSGTAEPQPS